MKLRKLILVLVTLIILTSLPVFAEDAAEDTKADSTYVHTEQYMSGKYYSRFAELNLTGEDRLDFVNVALSQYGYHEGDSEADLHGGNIYGTNDFTEYGYWYFKIALGRDKPVYSPWCAIFASWCARQANVSENVINNSAYARVGYNPYYFHVDYHDANGYLPQSGDLVFYDFSGTGEKWSHVGIVVYVENDKILTIEGNMSKQVRTFTRTLGYYAIRGFGTPRYQSSVNDPFDIAAYPVPTTTLRPGDTEESVKWAQNALLHLGYINPVDGHLGEMSVTAVKKFQADNGISTTGNVGPLTREALKQKLVSKEITSASPSVYPTPTRTLSIGNSGNDVKWLQAALKKLGFNAHTTGYFGSLTKQRVLMLQKTWGILQTGNLGPLTRTAIIERLGLNSQPAESAPDPAAQYPVPTRTLQKGNSGDDVRWLQFTLKKMGCNLLQGTGYYGDLTKNYVIWFQRAYGLPETGIFDAQCLEYMLMAVNSGT